MARGRSKVDDRVAAVLAKRPWDEDDARVALEAFDTSGMSGAAFAREHGFTRERLWGWRPKLGDRRPRAEALPALLPVRVVDTVPTIARSKEPEARASLGSGVEVVVRDSRRVRLAQGFDAETLYRAVEVLEVLPC